MLRVHCVLFLAIACAGCSSSEPKLIPVNGRVKLDSQALTGATVYFENAELGVSINAPLDADGHFSVKSYRGEGLPAGTYKVAVLPGGVMSVEEEGPKAHEAKMNRPKPSAAIPERYHSTSTSGLTIEVVPDRNEPHLIELKP